MEKRHIVQIPVEQVQKLRELDNFRKDLIGYPISKKVHFLLQEKLKEVFQKINKGEDKGDDWAEYMREIIPTQIFAIVAIGITKYSEEMIGTPFTKILVASEGDKTWWGNYNKDIKNVGKFLLANFQDEKFFQNYFSKYDKVIKEFRERTKKLRKEDFSNLSKENILEKYNLFLEDFMRFMGLAMDIDAIDFHLEGVIKEKFQKIIPKEKELGKRQFSEKYSLLTSPTEFSYINIEEIAILKLAKEIKEKNIAEPFSDPSIKEKINKLTENFWWTSLGWTQMKENNPETYMLKIKDALEKNIEEELTKINTSIPKIKEEKEQLSKEFNFDDEIKFYLKVFEKYVLLHDFRKENQMRGTSILNKFISEIAKIDDIRHEDLIWAWPDEIKEYLRGETINLEKIRSRKGAFFAIIEKDNIRQLTGEEAIRTRKKILSVEKRNIFDFEGMGVSLGKVIGRARICHSSADAIRRVKKGDILVASMTLPDYVPAMKKAAAIVTDEGGITSHAAIVSRELGIPCISGTKIATKILKDDDLIEVNANHGRVKILKKHN